MLNNYISRPSGRQTMDRNLGNIISPLMLATRKLEIANPVIQKDLNWKIIEKPSGMLPNS